MGTSLGTGLATAVNRLKNSKAKSRIIVLLTDGFPEGDDKISPEQAMELAKEFGIKVYTIGIGSEKESFIPTRRGHFQRIQTSFDKRLLKKIAARTGGTYFQARNPKVFLCLPHADDLQNLVPC